VTPADEPVLAAQPFRAEQFLAQDVCSGPGCSDPTSVMEVGLLESRRNALFVTLTAFGE